MWMATVHLVVDPPGPCPAAAHFEKDYIRSILLLRHLPRWFSGIIRPSGSLTQECYTPLVWARSRVRFAVGAFLPFVRPIKCLFIFRIDRNIDLVPGLRFWSIPRRNHGSDELWLQRKLLNRTSGLLSLVCNATQPILPQYS
jgi:hypothetical protein